MGCAFVVWGSAETARRDAPSSSCSLAPLPNAHTAAVLPQTRIRAPESKCTPNGCKVLFAIEVKRPPRPGRITLRGSFQAARPSAVSNQAVLAPELQACMRHQGAVPGWAHSSPSVPHYQQICCCQWLGNPARPCLKTAGF